MKKYILTESQVKKVIDHLINEQKMSPEDMMDKKNKESFDAVWNNPPISQQMKKFPNAKFAFSSAKLRELDKDHTNRLYKVQKGDVVSKLVSTLAANSEYNIWASNDLLKKNDPNTLQAGMVIAYSLAPSGGGD